MYEKLGELRPGYTSITDMDSKHPDMLQDVGIYTLVVGETVVLLDEKKESAILLLEGEVRLEWNGNAQDVKRDSVFEEEPWCLHVPKGVEVTIQGSPPVKCLCKKPIMTRSLRQNCIRQMIAKVLLPVKVYGTGRLNG